MVRKASFEIQMESNLNQAIQTAVNQQIVPIMEQNLPEIKAQEQLALIDIDATYTDYAQQLQDLMENQGDQTQIPLNWPSHHQQQPEYQD
jgi:hypothetical protein